MCIENYQKKLNYKMIIESLLNLFKKKNRNSSQVYPENEI